MAALPNIGGAVCSTPQSLADAHWWRAVTPPRRETVEISWGAPNYNETISAASGLKFTIL